MKQNQCEFCTARKRVWKLVLAAFVSMLAGMAIGDMVRPFSADLALFMVCLGLAGTGIALYYYVGAVNHFEDLRRSSKHDH